MAAYLVPLDAAGSVIPLEKAILLVGRQADCDVSITTSRKISRRHCALAVVNNTVMIRDLGSTNGVTVNGTRIDKEVQLAWGDEVTIGDVRFRFQKDAKPAVPQAPRANALPTGAPTLNASEPDEHFSMADDAVPSLPETLGRSRPKGKAAPEFVDSGPLVPFQPAGDSL